MNKKKQGLSVLSVPIYRYWQALYMAFYSPRLYVDVAKRWRGYGVLYTLLLLSIVITPLSVRIIYDFNQYMNEDLIAPIRALPPLYVQNGHVVFEKPMPYLIKNTAGEVVAAVDTTGVISGITKEYPHLEMLITTDKLYFRAPQLRFFLRDVEEENHNDIYVQNLESNSNEVFVGADWVKSRGILKLKPVVMAIIYPCMLGFVFGSYAVLMLFFAFIGQLFALIIFKLKLTFQDACRIFLVASTPQVTVFFITLAFNVVIPGQGFLYIVLLSLYFSYAILSVKRESNQLVTV